MFSFNYESCPGDNGEIAHWISFELWYGSQTQYSKSEKPDRKIWIFLVALRTKDLFTAEES